MIHSNIDLNEIKNILIAYAKSQGFSDYELEYDFIGDFSKDSDWNQEVNECFTYISEQLDAVSGIKNVYDSKFEFELFMLRTYCLDISGFFRHIQENIEKIMGIECKRLEIDKVDNDTE